MADEWETVGMAEVKPGDRVRFRGFEFTVARVDERFLGRDEMVCLIEDEPERWMAYPGPISGEVERQAS